MAQRPRRRAAKTLTAEVGLAALGEALAVPAAAVGDLGSARHGVSQPEVALDDLLAVSQDELCPGPRARRRQRGLSRRAPFGGTGPLHHRGSEPKQPTAPPRPHTAQD